MGEPTKRSDVRIYASNFEAARPKMQLSGLFDRLGIATATEHDQAQAALDSVCEPKGYRVHVVGLRHGKLIVEATGHDAELLAWDRDQCLWALDQALGLRHVTQITARRPRQPN